MLDKFIVEEKAEMLKYALPHMEDDLRYPGKDQSNLSMHLFGNIIQGREPIAPHVLDDYSVLD